MHITLRGFLFLLVSPLLLAFATWLPFLRWIALTYIIASVLIFYFDWQFAGSVEQFQIWREHDHKLSLAAENPIRVLLRTTSRRTIRFWVRDEPPDEFIVSQRIFEGQVAPRSTWEVVYHVRPVRRGDYAFGRISMRWPGPLGMVVRYGRTETSVAVKVYPNLLEIRRYDLLLRRNRLQEIGLRNSRMFGEGTEFERLRDYLADDDFRRINWKATARRNKPITVEYQTERSQNIVLAIDAGRMMQSPIQQVAKLDYVINAVLLFGYVATGLGDKIGLMTFADTPIQFLAPRSGRGQFYRMLETLYGIEAQPVEPDFRRALATLAARQQKRALVILFTDLTGGMSMEMLVRHITVLAKRSLPLIVTLSDPDIVEASRQIPYDSLAVYQREAASQVLDERKVALDTLARRGVLSLDVPANQLSIAVINRYLELKARNLL